MSGGFNVFEGLSQSRNCIAKSMKFCVNLRSKLNDSSLFLQESLKVLRLLDDKIIYRLNKSVPTTSFAGEVNAENKCKELYTEVCWPVL